MQSQIRFVWPDRTTARNAAMLLGLTLALLLWHTTLTFEPNSKPLTMNYISMRICASRLAVLLLTETLMQATAQVNRPPNDDLAGATALLLTPQTETISFG